MNKNQYLALFKEHTKDPVWCPGCGDFAELTVWRQALSELAAEDAEMHLGLQLGDVPELAELEILTKLCYACDEAKREGPHYFPRYEPHTVVTDSGIGCAGQAFAYINTVGVKTTHGRVLPAALGLKIARPDLTVIPQGGDGDAFAIGGGHFANFGFNVDITYLITNNEVYGLTKGQVSPSSSPNLVTGVNPRGPVRVPVNPVLLALGAGWTFIARLANVGKMKDGFDTSRFSIDVVKKAIRHRGASVIVFETECPTYNKMKTREWLLEHITPIPESHNLASAKSAAILALEENYIPFGIYYQVRRSTLHERFGIVKPLFNLRPDMKQVQKFMEQFM